MPARILVVDDEPQFERLILQRLRKEIQERKYDFRFTADGMEVLAAIGADSELDMVLTDINMPRMDGLTLLQRIRESQCWAPSPASTTLRTARTSASAPPHRRKDWTCAATSAWTAAWR